MAGEIIRPMERADVSRVHEIECTCFRSPWSKLALLGELRNEVARYLVMEVDGVICGYGGMWVLFEEAHVTNVAIMPDYRGTGRGKRLMLAMMRLAVKNGAEKMTLEVRESNLVAQRLYMGLDFEQNGFRPGYYSDTGEGAKLLWNNDIQQTLDREKNT
ncbi:MAG: ribosomal-protein-alanine N-acetyltransferase [Firmicutes bacterium HGW-Firmicutes-9]|jgi:ribosomal-protein-alanine N-acetyltransferase|nr:MAG: ribosomal-protein-alanine N-acetyltransferase [Firmicutes bacterium HGW-Firmicutes-9]